MALMLLDTYGLVYRAFFALPGLTTSDGVPINAVYGFTMMLNKLIADEKPTHVIAAFDKGMPAERVALFAEYKAQRRVMPDELRSQFALVRRVLETYRIPIVEIEGQEADDVIATLARQAEETGEQTIVVTGDLDLLQIVTERTTVLTTRRGITELGRYDPAAVRERFGLDPAQLPDYRGLKGDPSDNLPGIPGVGEKTASKLLQAAGSLDALVADPSLAGNPKLTRLDRAVRRTSLPLPRGLDRAPRSSARDRLGREPLPRASRRRSLRALQRARIQNAACKTAAARRPSALRKRHEDRGKLPQLRRVRRSSGVRTARRRDRRLRAAGRVAFALHGDVLGATAREGEGISFSRAALADEGVRAALERLFAAATPIGAYDAKRLLHAFHEAGIANARFADDAMIAAHLLDPSRGFADIEDAAAQLLRPNLPPTRQRTPTRRCGLIEKARAELGSARAARVSTKTWRFRSRRFWRRWKRPASRSTCASFAPSAKKSRARPNGCSGASTISPAKSSTSDRRNSSARCSSASSGSRAERKPRPAGPPASKCCRAWRASIRSARSSSSGAKSRSSRTPTSTSSRSSSIRATGGCARSSTKRRRRPDGSRRRIPTCKTFRFAANWAGAFAAPSSRATTSTCCSRPITAKSSCA